MSFYQTDDFGEYRVTAQFIDAWVGEHGCPGWQSCEVRQYADTTTRLVRGDAKYLAHHPEQRQLHSIYMLAKAGLE